MKLIYLKKSLGTVIIEKTDYDLLRKDGFRIELSKSMPRVGSYISAWAVKGRSPKCTRISLARFILNIGNKKIIVDHINHNALDNRRSNLRLANKAQNRMYSRKHKVGTSKFKGVSKRLKCPKTPWIARITVNKQCRVIGYFKDEIEAAKAYDECAKKHFGEFAFLNFK